MTQPSRPVSTRYTKTCVTCETEFTARMPFALYCTERCKGWAHRVPGTKPPELRDKARGCEQCGASMAGRHGNARFCDQKCWHRFHNPPPDLTVPRTCDVCSVWFMRKFTHGLEPKFCSGQCEQWRRRNPDRVWQHQRNCDHCGTDINHMRSGAKYCNPSCASAFLGHRRRVTIRSLPHDAISKYKVFDRDGWRCQLCSKPISKTLKHPDPLSPSLDHVIPISEPGSPGHVWTNVQASHLTCNLKKHTRSMGEQLALL